MTGRYANLKKVMDQPAARALAMCNFVLDSKLDLPVKASIEETLNALESTDDGSLDIFRVLSAVLPAREGVWWACLATRDLASVANNGDVSPILSATESWVFKPTEENLHSIKLALDSATVDDESTLCGTAALFANGRLGPGELDEFEAPPGASAMMIFGSVVKSWSEYGENIINHENLLIERALNLARGGDGKVTVQQVVSEVTDDDPDLDEFEDDDIADEISENNEESN